MNIKAFTRCGVASILAISTTFGLLFVMQYLITTADRRLQEDTINYKVDFVEVDREQIVKVEEEQIEKPPPPDTPPPEPPPPELDNVDPAVDSVQVAAVGPISTSIEVSADGFSLATGDGEYLPLVKVEPIYPRRALSREIEGYVLLEFTVTEQGTVKDIRVIESEPDSTIFHQAAIRAAEKFKYKPRVIDGQSVEVPGVQNKITFELSEEG